MTTETELRARLQDLADDAPPGALAGGDVWRSGVRRDRLRRAGAAAGAAVVVALVAGLGALVPWPDGPPPTEDRADPGLPRVVRPPDPWAEPTDRPGPLSALSLAYRRTASGLTGVDQRLVPFGISATDGIARFLDLPGRPRNLDDFSFALSPDGTQMAMTRYSRGFSRTQSREVVRGWDVLELTTGELTRLRLPGRRAISGTFAYPLTFTGDGRYLQTTYALDDAGDGADDRSGALVAWDLVTGKRHVAEGPGHRWVAGSARAPRGVVWTRQRTVHTLDPLTGDRTETVVPHRLVDAAYAPDGATLAYVGHVGERPASRDPRRLHVRSPDGTELTGFDVGTEPGQVLGWRDDDHVVVSDYGPRGARVVDLTTGGWEPLDLQQGHAAMLTPKYATDLLANPIAAAVDQPVVGDPRPWMWTWVRWTLAAALLLGALLAVLLRRRRG